MALAAEDGIKGQQIHGVWIDDAAPTKTELQRAMARIDINGGLLEAMCDCGCELLPGTSAFNLLELVTIALAHRHECVNALNETTS